MGAVYEHAWVIPNRVSRVEVMQKSRQAPGVSHPLDRDTQEYEGLNGERGDRNLIVFTTQTFTALLERPSTSHI